MEQEVSQPVIKGDLPTISSLLDQSFTRYQGLFRYFIPISIAIFVISILQIFLGQIYQYSTQPIANTVWSVVIGIVSYLAGIFAYSLSVQVISRKDSAQAVSQGEIYRSTVKMILPYTWVALLVAATLCGSLILLVIPGIIVALLISFSYFAFLADGKRGIEALATSWQMVRGRWWRTFWRFLVFGLVVALIYFFVGVILGFGGLHVTPAKGYVNIPAGLVIVQLINAFFFVPLGVAFLYSMYRALSSTYEPVTPEENHKIVRTIKRLAVLGVIVAAVFVVLSGLGFAKYGSKFLIKQTTAAAVWTWFM